METKLYKFTLLAASYEAVGIGTCRKPFSLILPEDDPRIEAFRCAAFKEESVDGTGAKINPVPPITTPVPQIKDATNEGAPIETIIGPTINKAVVKILKKEGYEFTGDVLDEDNPMQALTSIDKIGDKTAEKVITACRDRQ